MRTLGPRLVEGLALVTSGGTRLKPRESGSNVHTVLIMPESSPCCERHSNY
jgi:hypothetical protein